MYSEDFKKKIAKIRQNNSANTERVALSCSCNFSSRKASKENRSGVRPIRLVEGGVRASEGSANAPRLHPISRGEKGTPRIFQCVFSYPRPRLALYLLLLLMMLLPPPPPAAMSSMRVSIDPLSVGLYKSPPAIGDPPGRERADPDLHAHPGNRRRRRYDVLREREPGKRETRYSLVCLSRGGVTRMKH